MLLPQVVDINTLVTQMEKLLRRVISEEVELVTTLAPDLRPVPGHLEMLFLTGSQSILMGLLCPMLPATSRASSVKITSRPA